MVLASGVVSAVAALGVAAAFTPGYGASVSTATARTGPFTAAHTPGPSVAKPVITGPANGSIVQLSRSGGVEFTGTGQPNASLDLYYRAHGTTDWHKLDGFTANVAPDGHWKQNAHATKKALPGGIYDFRVTQTSDTPGTHHRDSAALTLTNEEDGTPCTPSKGFSHCLRFDYTGADQSFTVPLDIDALNVRAWGAGGGSAFYSDTRGGGGGGYTTGTVRTTSGQDFRVMAGQGGSVQRGRTYGGGGAAGTGANYGGSGGGMSALWQGTSPLLIAGGGGGGPGMSKEGASAHYAGGGGGGEQGSAVPEPVYAKQGGPGTQTAGGAQGGGGSCSVTPPRPGTRFQGGDGGSNPRTVSAANGGSGGGGGWYGGGGGMCADNGKAEVGGGGGGGSGHIDPTRVTNGQTVAGTASTTRRHGGEPARTTDDQYTGRTGHGGASDDGAGNGGNGLVVIQWQTSAPPQAAPPHGTDPRSGTSVPAPPTAPNPPATTTEPTAPGTTKPSGTPPRTGGGGTGGDGGDDRDAVHGQAGQDEHAAR